MEQINVKPEDALEYYKAHVEDSECGGYSSPIALNEELGVEIYITEYNGAPTVEVYEDDILTYVENIISDETFEDQIGVIYDVYLGFDYYSERFQVDEFDELQSCLSYDDYDDDDDEYSMVEELEDNIDSREMELDNAIEDFIDTAAGRCVTTEMCASDPEEYSKMVEDIKDKFLGYINYKYGVSVWRPTYITFEDGIERLVDFPYDAIPINTVSD